MCGKIPCEGVLQEQVNIWESPKWTHKQNKVGMSLPRPIELSLPHVPKRKDPGLL